MTWPLGKCGGQAAQQASGDNTMRYITWVACSMLDERCDSMVAWKNYLEPLLTPIAAHNGKDLEECLHLVIEESQMHWKVAIEEEEDDAETLCDTTFTLAFGSKILLHNTKLKLKRGMKYGLVGGSDSGKTSLLRAIANEQIDGFPDFSTVRTTFLEADIAPDLSNMTCVEFVMADTRIQSMGIGEPAVRGALNRYRCRYRCRY
jgi:elongation factor 3